MKSRKKALDLKEIIFEGRNKEYGAYVLGRLYNRYVSLSTTGAILLFILLVSYPLIMAFFIPEENTGAAPKIDRVIFLENFHTEIPADKKEIQIPKTTSPKTSMVKFIIPQIKPDELATNEAIPTQEELAWKNPGTETVEGNINGRDIVEEIIESDNSDDAVVKEEIFTWAEEMPQFPGGSSELLKFFAQNIIYPEIAKRAEVEGKINLSFIVDKNGSISDIQIVKGIGAGCDEEAVRILKMMPRWSPGKQNGKPVLTRINIPVVFKLR